MPDQPNILFVMTDQQRLDTIAALGNAIIRTPNLDRLVRRGTSFRNTYSTCPVCVPARSTIRSGCEPLRTGLFQNARRDAADIERDCGPYLARTMAARGYRTFGIGKFHSFPWDADLGFEYQRHSEELYADADQRHRDGFAAFIREQHPAFDYVEGLMGERTEMYYMPQVRPMPADLAVEAWAAREAVAQVRVEDERPWFGFVSFIGPHPPFAPPIPFNRMYDPDRLPDPVVGDPQIDHMDEMIPFMNYAVYAEDIDAAHARVLKARYYDTITYIDECIGSILDAVESRADADNTVICFFSDHGDHLGDHHAWQKESFFEASCNVPFLLSWPGHISAGSVSDELVCLTDLFAIATGASGEAETRDGVDVLSMLSGAAPGRSALVGYHADPGTRYFKTMVRQGPWKYIFLANGDREQLFNVDDDPAELTQRATDHPEIAAGLRAIAVERLSEAGCEAALAGGDLRGFEFEARPLRRIRQFDHSRGIRSFRY